MNENGAGRILVAPNHHFSMGKLEDRYRKRLKGGSTQGKRCLVLWRTKGTTRFESNLLVRINFKTGMNEVACEPL